MASRPAASPTGPWSASRSTRTAASAGTSTSAAGSSNSGKIILRDIEIAWNGCGERVATGEPWACWAQKTGGYGDGLGTTDTGGQFLVEDAFVHHNTSDGLDFRYMDGAPTTSVTLRRVYSVANAGNQVKVKGNSVIENSVLVSQCGYFKGRYYMLADDSCRASGNTLQLVFTQNNTAVVRHNTITGEGGVLIGAIEGDTTNKVLIQDNVLVGFPVYRDPSKQSSVFYANKTGAVASYRATWSGRSRATPAPPAASAAGSQAHQHDPRRLRCRAPRRQPGDRRGAVPASAASFASGADPQPRSPGNPPDNPLAQFASAI